MAQKPSQRCFECGQELTAPEWSQFVTESRICQWWKCSCGCEFEAFVDLSSEAKLQPEIAEQYLSTLLVA